MKTIEVEKKQQIMNFIPISKSYKKTISDFIYDPHWLQAAKNEISQLKDNNTYIIEVPLEKANIVTYKWVFAIKYNQNDTIQRFKTKLMIKEFSQIHKIDYNETFIFIVRINILRAMLALIIIKNLEIDQINVNNTFIKSTLKYLIYMNTLPLINIKQKEYLKLLQSLYDLKQITHD